MRHIDLLKITLMAAVLTACQLPSVAPPPESKDEPRDGPPPGDVDVSGLQDAIPRVEPITIAGNKSPYTVLGKTYRVLPSSKGYREEGMASWYGSKFHGRKTSNGEIYDMYSLSAAHKTLPIPSYVKVRNLENGREVIVRINDRGPFHSGRIIDLSYAAAKKLGYSGKGTAMVEVTAIDPAAYQRNFVEAPGVDNRTGGPPAASSGGASSGENYRLPGNTFLQAGAFSTANPASNLRSRIQSLTEYPVEVRRSDDHNGVLYKVLVGPFVDNLELLNLRNLLQRTEKLAPFVVYDAIVPDKQAR